MPANTKYKDSVFSLLFSDPDLLRELYCALEGVDLPLDIPVTINTLQDVLFMDRINDISFEIDGKLIVLLEHQSTVNPNIPLRLLMYIFEDSGLERTEAVKQAVKYCRDHDILKEFMEKNSSEVFNMLFNEWNWDDAIAVNRQEAREEGREEGWGERDIAIAHNALAKGLPLELIRDLTGLDIETIARLQPGV